MELEAGSLIGQRVEYKKQKGTILYQGCLKHNTNKDKQNEEWLGIEWDLEDSGKHQGTVEGIEYFTCNKQQGNNGSLVKSNKVELGCSILQALLLKYFNNLPQEFWGLLHKDEHQLVQDLNQYILQLCQQYELNHQNNNQITEEVDQDIYVETVSKKKKVVQFYGFDQIWTKISNMNKIKEVSLCERQVSKLGGEGVLRQMFGNLQQLSLENNLLFTWDQIYFIGRELPGLQELSISGNQLQLRGDSLYQQDIVIGQQTYQCQVNTLFKSLHRLIVNQMGLTWKHFAFLLGAFQQVKEWIMVNNKCNDYHNLASISTDRLQQIQLFNLEGNHITDFQHLIPLGKLQELNKLVLNKNKMHNIGSLPSPLFPRLNYLSLEGNCLKDNVCMFQLTQLLNLKHLLIRNNFIGDIYTTSYVRQRCIAENKQLLTINGSDLNKYERKDCEIYYLRKTFDDYFKASGYKSDNYSLEKFIEFCQLAYGRIGELLTMYGNPYEKAPPQQQNEQIKVDKGLKKLAIQVMVGEYIGQNFNQRQYPQTTTIASLKAFLAKLVKLPKHTLLLQFKSHSNSQQVLQDMDDDDKCLADYFHQDSALIVINQHNK